MRSGKDVLTVTVCTAESQPRNVISCDSRRKLPFEQLKV